MLKIEGGDSILARGPSKERDRQWKKSDPLQACALAHGKVG